MYVSLATTVLETPAEFAKWEKKVSQMKVEHPGILTEDEEIELFGLQKQVADGDCHNPEPDKIDG